jgi:hypothetical protein
VEVAKEDKALEAIVVEEDVSEEDAVGPKVAGPAVTLDKGAAVVVTFAVDSTLGDGLDMLDGEVTGITVLTMVATALVAELGEVEELHRGAVDVFARRELP